MIQVLVLTTICLIGATVGYYFLEGKALKTTLEIIGWMIWYALTFSWWWSKLLDKLIK